ncbi:hypothetical protein SKAU_G00055520 [Synaphobranchus kaupii]|uniref:Uncharacterized protein n=1 Tax=Synaphobranchus kaupii TaxID=118154 RepID=A0A9Q1JA75_SYNKA|nr:hypothetical protein SKAU_G00055520 [Synaphobranchus kaupii]
MDFLKRGSFPRCGWLWKVVEVYRRPPVSVSRGGGGRENGEGLAQASGVPGVRAGSRGAPGKGFEQSAASVSVYSQMFDTPRNIDKPVTMPEDARCEREGSTVDVPLLAKSSGVGSHIPLGDEGQQRQ